MVKLGSRVAIRRGGGYAREIGRWRIERVERHSEGDDRVAWLKEGEW